jgi:hypothetical protein
VIAGRISRLETTDGRVSGVRLDDGQVMAVDAVVVSTRMVARAAPFAGIGIKPTPHPAGEFNADLMMEDLNRAVAALNEAPTHRGDAR